MNPTQETHHAHKIGTKRIIAGVVLFVILLLIAWAVRAHTNQATAPGQSTQQSQPNSQQNTPPGGSVDQGANASSDTTPSPNGTNGVEGAGR